MIVSFFLNEDHKMRITARMALTKRVAAFSTLSSFSELSRAFSSNYYLDLL